MTLSKQATEMLLEEAASDMRRVASCITNNEWDRAHENLSHAMALIKDVHENDEWVNAVFYTAQSGENLWRNNNVLQEEMAKR